MLLFFSVLSSVNFLEYLHAHLFTIKYLNVKKKKVLQVHLGEIVGAEDFYGGL